MLNPQLYRQLMRYTGNKVKISSENQPFIYEIDRLNPKKIHTKSGGEYYQICCPQCGDTKYRLWINHRYGTWEPYTQHYLWELAVCYHKTVSTAKRVRDIFGNVRDLTEAEKKKLKEEQPNCDTSWLKYLALGANLDKVQVVVPTGQTTISIESPGLCVPLASLPSDHVSKVYLKTRGFDIDWLLQNYPVSWCMESKNLSINNRIVFQIEDSSAWRGFQARAPFDEPPPDPKWYTCRGMKKSQVLYNLDYAVSTGVVVLTEGIFDALACGRSGVCSFGKSLHHYQAKLLAERMRDKGIVVVAYDPDAKGWTKKAVDTLRPVVNKVVGLTLPDERDPGKLGFKIMRDLIREKADAEISY